MIRLFCVCVLVLFSFVHHLQSQTLLFELKNGSLGQYFYLKNKSDSVLVETFRFYISNLRVYRMERPISRIENHFFLVDFETGKNRDIDLQTSDSFDCIAFDVGIDSATNVSGVMPGDLDPTNDMYWTWHSGYINIKLEGVSNIVAARKHRFQFHLGGYLSPHNALQKLTWRFPKSKSVTIKISLEEIIDQINLSHINEVMSPSERAVEISKSIAKQFHLVYE